MRKLSQQVLLKHYYTLSYLSEKDSLYQLSLFVIKEILGNDVYETFFFDIESRINDFSIFFSRFPKKHIIALGELLFNLQHIEGLKYFLINMKNISLQSHLAELYVGKMLYVKGLSFAYIKPKKNQFTPDIKLYYKDTVCHCEVKSRMHGSNIDADVLLKKIKKTIKNGQLADVQNGYLFFHIPKSYLALINQDVFVHKLDTILVGYPHIAGVVFFYQRKNNSLGYYPFVNQSRDDDLTVEIMKGELETSFSYKKERFSFENIR